MRSSQVQIDELDALLDELDQLVGEAKGDYAPLASELDGFLTALVVSTEQVPQEEWLGALFSGSLGLLSKASAARLTDLVLARKAVIASQLLQGRGALEPIFEVDELHDEVLWEVWIEGFDRAMRLRHEAWMALLDGGDEAVAEAVTELVLLIGIALSEVKSRKHDQITAEAHVLIPFLAEVVYRRSRGLPGRVLDPEPQQPIRTTKVGRNEPCPCGSGKKYKKCCGR